MFWQGFLLTLGVGSALLVLLPVYTVIDWTLARIFTATPEED